MSGHSSCCSSLYHSTKEASGLLSTVLLSHVKVTESSLKGLGLSTVKCGGSYEMSGNISNVVIRLFQRIV